MVWRDKLVVHILTNMRPPPTNDNMCNELGKAIKPEIRCVGCVNLTGQDDKELLDTTPDIEVDKKMFLLLMHDCSKQLPSLDCVWDQNDSLSLPNLPCAELDKRAGHLLHPHQPVGRPCVAQKWVIQLEVNVGSHWPFASSGLYSQFCTRNKRKSSSKVQEV
jgi:hypothetical protein